MKKITALLVLLAGLVAHSVMAQNVISLCTQIPGSPNPSCQPVSKTSPMPIVAIGSAGATAGYVYTSNGPGVAATFQATPAVSITISPYSVYGNNTGSSASGSSIQALTLGVPNITDTGILAQLTSSVAGYNQLVIQNTNSGATASSNFVVNNNNGTATTYYGEFGMNSSGFTGSGSFNKAGAVYLDSQSGDLVLGTLTSNPIHFVVNNGTTDAMYIATSGNVGIGTATPAGGLDNYAGYYANGQPLIPAPGGRLTLSSTLPIMTTDITAATTVYYLPYNGGSTVPVYNGTYWAVFPLTSSGLSLTLNTTNHPTTELFDVYAVNNSGSVALCGLYWGGATARSASAGGKGGNQNATISQINGLWTNTASVAASECYNGTTAYAFSANQGTYLGTFYTSAAGQSQFNVIPAGASGGSNNIEGIFNAYNQINMTITETDNNTNYAYTTSSWRACDGNNNNRITFVDGLGNDTLAAFLQNYLTGGTIGINIQLALDAVSPNGTGSQPSFGMISPTGTESITGVTTANFNPVLGVHYLQCLEFGNAGDSFTPLNHYSMTLLYRM